MDLTNHKGQRIFGQCEMKDVFLSLVRIGIGHPLSPVCLDKIDWAQIEVLANQQGLSAIILDGVEQLPESKRPPKLVLLQWIGNTLQSYENRYEFYRKAIAELAGFYNEHGYKMMVLKGFACAMNWPKPEHRPCGDIDIWLFGKQKEADFVLSKENGIVIDLSHHHHTVFDWRGFTVENHYDFVNVHHSKSNAEIEKVFKDLGKDDSHYVEVFCEKVNLPSPNLHALFLLRHAMIEFTASSINIRQVLDWAFYVEKHTNEIDWNWLKEQLEKFYMKDFFNCINAICVENLGFIPSVFPSVQINPVLKERVIKEILEPAIPNNKPKNIFARLIWKCRRWKANEWKHELCYRESMWSSFWSGVWGHLLKPASI